jgi:hypothetical protein
MGRHIEEIRGKLQSINRNLALTWGIILDYK